MKINNENKDFRTSSKKDIPILNTVLRLLRIIKDENSSQFAEHLGISQSLISQIESGKKSPSLDLLKKYSDYMGIELSTILFFSEEKKDITFQHLMLKILKKIAEV